MVPAMFAADASVKALLLDLLPISALGVPLVSLCMALEAALAGAQEFRFLAASTVGTTALTAAAVVYASGSGALMSRLGLGSFTVKTIWWAIFGLFILRSLTAGLKLREIILEGTQRGLSFNCRSHGVVRRG